MIVQDTFMKYDDDGHFYYLTVVGAKEYSGYDVDTNWKNQSAEMRLKRHGRLLHRFLTRSAYNGKNDRYRHQDIIEYFIYLNVNGEREAVKQMLTELVIWTEEADGDKKQYEDKYVDGSGSKMPQAIKIEGITSGLYYTGELQYIVPEDEYRVGY